MSYFTIHHFNADSYDSFSIKYGGKGKDSDVSVHSGALGVIGIIMVKGAKSLFNIDLINVFNTLSTLILVY